MGADKASKKSKILVVDDEIDLRLLLKERLEMDGYDVEVAEDGEKALRTAKKTLPDLILLDVMMPRIDGFNVLERLKKDRLTMNIPVILLSARGESEAVKKGISDYAEKYILKPFDYEQLVIEIEKTLSIRGMGRE